MMSFMKQKIALSFVLILGIQADSSEDCYPFAVAFDFFNAQVTTNNLGGQGPNFSDAEEIRYSNIGDYDGESFDLVVQVRSGSNYVPANSGHNGLHGKFGQINLIQGESVDLDFSFRHPTTDALLVLPYFYFSLFDLDEGGGNREVICIDDDQYDSYQTVQNNNEMVVSTSTTSCADESVNSPSTLFSSTSRGYLCDNPADPLSLGIVTCEECDECTVGGSNSEYFPIDQKNRSIGLSVRDKSTFSFTFTVESQATTTGRNILFSGRSSLAPCPDPSAQPTFQPSPFPTKAPSRSTGTNGGGGRTCFSSEDKVTLESGEVIPLRTVKVGDSIMTANRDGETSYSKVVFLPHGENDKRTTFLEITTKGGKKIKMTRAHLLPLCSGALSTASKLQVGSCLRTVDGDDQVLRISSVVRNGVYTAVTENEFLVVNGIVASPFASTSALVHAFYNVTDMEDWCASNKWLAFKNAHLAQRGPAADRTLEEAEDRPSEDCLSMLERMFENFKDEPIGWGADGFGYRGHWANPAAPNLHRTSAKSGNVPSILSGWTAEARKLKN